MSARAPQTRKALIVQLGSLTRVLPAVGDAYWLDTSRDGEVGRDDPDEDIVHFAQVVRGRLVATESVNTTGDMMELLQRVIHVGLALAGIADVPPKR